MSVILARLPPAVQVAAAREQVGKTDIEIEGKEMRYLGYPQREAGEN